MSDTQMGFTLLQRVLHWLMAAAILTMLFIGVGMESTVKPLHLTLVEIHEPLGITILVLAAIRLIVRLLSGTPPLPADMPGLMKLAAVLSHYVLYLLMFAMPLIGWGMLSAAGYPILLFGSVRLPPILPQSAGAHAVLWSAHACLAFVFFAVVLGHVSAALFHAFIRRDGVFDAMTSGRSTHVTLSSRLGRPQ
jgi:cytochrome b561